MFRQIKIGMVCVLVVIVGLLPAYAATDVSIADVSFGGNDFGFGCADNFMSVNVTFTPTVDDWGGQGVDTVGLTAVDGNGVPLYAALTAASIEAGETTQTTFVALGIVNGGLNDITARPVTVRVYDIGVDLTTYNGTTQDAFDLLSGSGVLLATRSYDPAFGDPLIAPPECFDLPVPGYTFSRLDGYSVCTNRFMANYVVWRVRSYNLYATLFTARVPQIGAEFESAVGGILNANPGSGIQFAEREFITPFNGNQRLVLIVTTNGRIQDVVISNPRPC
jgi:hypothetical protein